MFLVAYKDTINPQNNIAVTPLNPKLVANDYEIYGITIFIATFLKKPIFCLYFSTTVKNNPKKHPISIDNENT